MFGLFTLFRLAVSLALLCAAFGAGYWTAGMQAGCGS